MFGFLKEMFSFAKPSPGDLYKKKQDQEFIESIRRSAIIHHGRGRVENLGLSEYGAQKMIEEGKTPLRWEKVLLANGDLISWEEWKEKNGHV